MNERELEAGLAPTPGYRYATVVGDELFVAGQVPLDAGGGLAAVGDPAGQAHRCLENLRILVDAHGFSTDDVRHLSVLVVGKHQHLLDAWAAVVAWWTGSVPPATLVGVNRLGYRDQLVEIDARIVRRS